ncbi:universal stress protein [Bacillus nitratireducens]|uniref:universal stress protein n=1 Tax=Bacillus nitratireducens TaxID=2026193 RepID=UPI001BA857AA|nr:universal stress protein [Bacillus nitratireducens]QUG82493.1 universal stress protein [Bacillus nitratireducens]
MYKILVAIDGSELSNEALEKALLIAKKQKTQLDILYVETNTLSSFSFGAFVSGLSFTGYFPVECLPNYWDEEIKIESEKILSKAQFKVKKDGFEACTFYLKGDPSQEITEFIQKNSYNLIIVGDQRIKKYKKRKLNKADKSSDCRILFMY